MCKPQTVCKITKGPLRIPYGKFPSLQYFYTHAVTGVTDNYKVSARLVHFAKIHFGKYVSPLVGWLESITDGPIY